MFFKAAMKEHAVAAGAGPCQLKDRGYKRIHRSQPHSYIDSRKTNAGLDDRNVGFRLLKKAGWEEGSGLGASSQGPKEPLQLPSQKGNEGLGFKTPNANVNKPSKKRKREDGLDEGSKGRASDGKGGVNVADLVAVELAAETTEQKVQLHRHRARYGYTCC